MLTASVLERIWTNYWLVSCLVHREVCCRQTSRVGQLSISLQHSKMTICQSYVCACVTCQLFNWHINPHIEGYHITSSNKQTKETPLKPPKLMGENRSGMPCSPWVNLSCSQRLGVTRTFLFVQLFLLLFVSWPAEKQSTPSLFRVAIIPLDIEINKIYFFLSLW